MIEQEFVFRSDLILLVSPSSPIFECRSSRIISNGQNEETFAVTNVKDGNFSDYSISNMQDSGINSQPGKVGKLKYSRNKNKFGAFLHMREL